jgi:hypothetical protein
MSKAAELAALIANVNKGSSLAAKNFIINGGMQVWQRATAATTTVNGQYKTADRWMFYEGTDGAYTTQQSTGNSGDTGHDTALQANVTTADGTIAADQYASLAYKIEAQNLQQLQWGTASGKNLVLSFWVKSNKTGIYSLSTEKLDTTSYKRVSEYTINSANTWEQKTINIPPLTNSNSGGTIANDNGVGIKFEFSLAYGSNFTTSSLDQWLTSAHYASTNQVNWMDSTSNDFYLTGVQLEIGEKATEFEHEPFETTLHKCQRYYYKHVEGSSYMMGMGDYYVDAQLDCVVHLPVTMRAVPSLVQTSGTNYYLAYGGAASENMTNAWNLWTAHENVFSLYAAPASNGTAGQARRVITNNSAAMIAMNAEL